MSLLRFQETFISEVSFACLDKFGIIEVWYVEKIFFLLVILVLITFCHRVWCSCIWKANYWNTRFCL